MLTNLLLPAVPGVRLQEVLSNEQAITLVMVMTSASAACPLCDRPSHRIHSRYLRKMADVPWSGVPVLVRLRVRRFFCDNSDCRRRICTERLHPAIALNAHRTRRLESLFQVLGVTRGGEAGAPLPRRFAMPISPATLLRVVLRTLEPSLPTPRVLGVDDWAKPKRHNYGTLLVDQERRQPVDLRPDRSPDSLITWLRDHPGVEIITRGRSCDHAQGAAQGAPEALRVADRWHLLGNWRQSLQRLLDHHTAQLRSLVQRMTEPDASSPSEALEELLPSEVLPEGGSPSEATARPP